MIPERYEFADGYHTLDHPAVGPFGKYRPYGATIHYTASGTLQSALNQEDASKLGYHVIIDRDGSVIQTCYFNKRVNHAGIAIWNTVSPNSHHLAIALVSWGLLGDNGESWAGTSVPDNEIRLLSGRRWHKATNEQEIALFKILRWLEINGMKRRNICGHDECCIPHGRKVDPGGVLSFSIEDYRKGK